MTQCYILNFAFAGAVYSNLSRPDQVTLSVDTDAVFGSFVSNDQFLILVAVVSNGTAVLGSGDIGPLAGKPVMEGKAVLFKRFADVDIFQHHNPDEVIQVCQLLEPTFGGINLEDIEAPAGWRLARKRTI
jgi:malic enzyme